MRRPTYSEVASTLALFIALGGTSYAVTSLPADSVGSAQLKSASVTASKLHAHAVGAAAVANDSLTGKQINESSLGTVPHASSATSADSATTAKSATSAKTATSADSATTANNATLLAGAPASSYVDSCPSGLLQIKDLCVEPNLREATDFDTAVDTCGAANLRLPSIGEAEEAFNVLGAPQNNQWTSDAFFENTTAYGTSIQEDANRRIDIGFVIADGGLTYRCVTTASN